MLSDCVDLLLWHIDSQTHVQLQQASAKISRQYTAYLITDEQKGQTDIQVWFNEPRCKLLHARTVVVTRSNPYKYCVQKMWWYHPMGDAAPRNMPPIVLLACEDCQRVKPANMATFSNDHLAKAHEILLMQGKPHKLEVTSCNWYHSTIMCLECELEREFLETMCLTANE